MSELLGQAPSYWSPRLFTVRCRPHMVRRHRRFFVCRGRGDFDAGAAHEGVGLASQEPATSTQVPRNLLPTTGSALRDAGVSHLSRCQVTGTPSSVSEKHRRPRASRQRAATTASPLSGPTG